MRNDCGPLAPNAVHIWTLPLDRCDNETESLVELLDPEELSRLERLRCPATVQRFIKGHAGLRLLLSHCSGMPCSEIRYVYGLGGKPELRPPAPFHFNLSHTHDLAVVAVSAHPVGVDIEKIDNNIPFETMAERFFSSAEWQALRSLPKERRLQAFYLCWTRKEAYLKATGVGFSLPSRCFDVSLSPDQPPMLLQHRLDPDEPLRWRLHDLLLPAGFQGSVAASSVISRIFQCTGTWNTHQPWLSHP